MNLDKRILPNKRPLTCLDVEQAREFEGKLCLFSPSFGNYKNISEYSEYPQYTGILTIKDDFKCVESEERPYRNGNDGYFYEFALPLEWVEEEKPKKTYRPYTLSEFLNHYSLGDEVIVRHKEDKNIKHKLFTEFMENNDAVRLGSHYYTLQDLYDRYEFYTGEGWKPFGVKE